MKKLFNHLTVLLFGVYGLKLVLLQKLIYYINIRYIVLCTVAIYFVFLTGIIGTLWILIKDKKRLTHKEELSYKTILFHIPLYALILIGILLAPKALTSSFIGQKPTSITNNKLQFTKQRTIHKRKIDYTFNDWYYTISISDDPEKLIGNPVKIIGFVSRDKLYFPDVFLLSRFVVTCCAVDATPIGFPVKSEITKPYKADQWVEVVGHLAMLKDRNNVDRLFIIPDTIQQVKEPKNPYIYDISWYYWGMSPPNL